MDWFRGEYIVRGLHIPERELRGKEHFAKCRTFEPSNFRFSISNILAVITICACGLFCATETDWLVGALITILTALVWHTRGQRYSTVPGAAVGVLICWFLVLPGYCSPPEPSSVVALTVLAALIGAILNALRRGCYSPGALAIFALFAVFVVAAIHG